MRLDADELLRLVAEGEGARLEFKRGLPHAPKVARTLAAFANTRGGRLLVGVDDRGRIEGAPRPRATAAELRAIAAGAVEPPVALNVETVRVDGRTVVAATVGLSPARPHSVLREDGERELPIRVGASTRAARGPSLEALRRGGGGRGPSAFEREVLAWVGRAPAAGASAEAFARDRNVGLARARRAFVKLERQGRLVGHGGGARRAYALP